MYWNVSIQKHLNKLTEQVLIFGGLLISFFVLGKLNRDCLSTSVLRQSRICKQKEWSISMESLPPGPQRIFVRRSSAAFSRRSL